MIVLKFPFFFFFSITRLAINARKLEVMSYMDFQLQNVFWFQSDVFYAMKLLAIFCLDNGAAYIYRQLEGQICNYILFDF